MDSFNEHCTLLRRFINGYVRSEMCLLYIPHPNGLIRLIYTVYL